VAEGEEFVSVRTERTGASVVVSVEGELDLAGVALLQEALTAAAAGGAQRVVLDLSALGFIDCTGAGLVLRAHRVLGHRLLIRPGGAQVHRLFEMLGLDRRLPFEGPRLLADPARAEANVAFVRRLWEAFAAGGAPAVAALLPPDVEWRPMLAPGGVLRSTEQFVAFWSARPVPFADPLEFIPIGSSVVVRVDVRLEGRAEERWCVYRFDAERLRQAQSFPTRAEAFRWAA
jgi:anti-sigma B factor antagonist